jgi:DNA repair photolyase
VKKIISASRRTDLVAHFSGWLSAALKEEKARVYGPSGHRYTVDLSPQTVHTFVLWSKNFKNLIENKSSLRDLLQKYDQLYLHFTITGLGGSFIERGAPEPSEALSQLDPLIKIVGLSERISVRFDPVLYWIENSELRTNIPFFDKMAPELHARGIKDIRISFAQWYAKAKARAAKYGFLYIDPLQKEKKEAANRLAQMAQSWDFKLYSCSQDFLSEVAGIRPSSCIDGPRLQKLHPDGEPASGRKDKSQRAECRCTESVDIGSYTQFCPHSCLYCYANPRI